MMAIQVHGSDSRPAVGVNPREWNYAVLGDVAAFSSGTTPPRARHAEFFEFGKHPWVKTMDLNNSIIKVTDECVTDRALAETSLKTQPAGSVLVAMYGGFQQIGRTGLLATPAAVNQAITVITTNRKKLLPAYLLYVLNYRVGYWRTVASSSRKDPNITSGDVKAFPIALPSIAEQDAISGALTDVDRSIAQLEQLIAKKQAIKRAMMQQLLTGGVRLPGFDRPWANVRLGAHVTYIKTVALSRAQLDTTSPLRCLHYGDIHTNPGVRLAAASTPMPRAPLSIGEPAGRLEVGDLVLADASEDPDGVGKSIEITSVPPDGVVAGLHTIAARFDKSVLADGFKAYLQFIPGFRRALLRLASGTKVLATTRSYISSITLPLPSVEEQHAIAHTLVECDEEIALLRDRLGKTRAIQRGMMQELLTGRTRLPAVEDAA